MNEYLFNNMKLDKDKVETPSENNRKDLYELLDRKEVSQLLTGFSIASGSSIELKSTHHSATSISAGSKDLCESHFPCCIRKMMDCPISDDSLIKKVKITGEACYIQCSCGLVRAAFPLVAEDIHLANLLTGHVSFSPLNRKDFCDSPNRDSSSDERLSHFLTIVPQTTEKSLFSSLELLASALINNYEYTRENRQRLQLQRERMDRELFLHRIIDQSPFATWISDEQGTMIKANRTLKKLLNVTDEQLLGKYNVFDDPVVKKNHLEEDIRGVYLKGKTTHFEVQWQGEETERMNLQGANTLVVEATLFPIFDSEGHITNGVCHWIDISKRKEAEEQLVLQQKELEQMVIQRTEKLDEALATKEQVERDLLETQTIFDAFLENNPIYVFFKDREIRSIRLSRNYEKMLGMPLEDLLGKTMDDLFPSELAKSMIADDKRILMEEKLLQVEEELNGHYFETMKFPIYIDGKAELLAGFTMDITERKKAEMELKSANAELKELTRTLEKTNGELKRSSAKTQSIIENTNSSIWAIDDKYKLIYINHIFKEDFHNNFGIELIEGMDLLKALPEPQRSQWKKRYDKVLSNHSFDLEEPMDLPGSAPIYIYLSAHPILVENRVIGASFFSTNITEKRVSQERLRQSQKLESIGQLAGGVAHNFNNMLLGIMGCTEILQQHLQDDDTGQQFLSMILESSERAADLAKKLLTFSKPQDIRSDSVNIHELIFSTAEMLKNTLDKRISIELDLRAEEFVTRGDNAHLQSVLLNLGINASQAIHKSGYIRYSTSVSVLKAEECREIGQNLREGRFIRIEVQDNGPGIPKEIMNRIFDPFFTTKSHIKGSGLGLSTALGIINSHMGAINVKSQESEGTLFTLWIPLTGD